MGYQMGCECLTIFLASAFTTLCIIVGALIINEWSILIFQWIELKLIDKTSGSGSIHEIQPGIVYKRFKRNFERINDTFGYFNITIASAQFDDCVREFNISVKSTDMNENDRVTKIIKLPCERINKEFLLLMGLMIFSFLVATSIAGIILQCYKILKPSLRYVPS